MKLKNREIEVACRIGNTYPANKRKEKQILKTKNWRENQSN
jgi:hypothetical protein